MRRRTFLASGFAAVAAPSLMACSTSDPTEPPRSGASTTGSAATTGSGTGPGGFAARAARYLSVAAQHEPASDASRARVWRAAAQASLGQQPELSVADLETITERFARFEDTTDFDMVALINLWYRSDFGAMVPEETAAHLRRLILEFKYWYAEPQPEGITDERWYWSENHQILFHVIEYLAGQAFPDETFTNDGRSGSDHMDHARPLIERWVEQRTRWGFSEWYSAVYYQEDLEAAITLAEFSDDEDLATLGAIAADLVLYDIAGHSVGSFVAATQGRTYKKDKMSGPDTDTWDLATLVFGTDVAYGSATGSVYLASAAKYRPPAVLGAIHDAASGAATEPTVERARHSLALDPLAEVSDSPEAPMGLAFDDHDNLMTYWAMAAMTPWQTVIESTDEMTAYNLWDSKLFAPFAPFRPIVEAADADTVRGLARSLAPQLNIGLLSEANTYTWRSGGTAQRAMLSTVQDYRKGQASQQHHIWQATLSSEAIVFTTHPRVPTEAGVPWRSNSDDWTGGASMPRSAQHENLNVSIYAPLYASGDNLQGSYVESTHAYFPQERFDEVTTVGNWVLGRVGDNYVALYSWRPLRWVSYDPAEYDTDKMTEPFELVADGGPNNVWITELGSAGEYATFEAFVAAITANEPVVTPLGDAAVFSTGFNVEWVSPSQGLVEFGWERPFTVGTPDAATTVELSEYPRIDAPWAQVAFDSTAYDIEAGGETLHLDVVARTRRSSGDL